MTQPTAATSAHGVLRNSGLLALLQAFQMVLGVAITLLLAWLLTVPELATYGAVFRVSSWFMAFCVFLLPTILVRYVAELNGQGDRATSWQLLDAALGFQVVVLLVVLLIAWTIPGFVSSPFFLPVALAVMLSGIIHVFDPFLRGFQDFGSVATSAAWGSVVRLVALTVLLLLGTGVLGALWSVTIGLLVNLVFVVERVGRLPRPRKRGRHTWRKLLARVGEYGAAMGAGGFLSLVIWNYVEVFFLARATDESGLEQLAFYTLAVSLAMLPTRFGKTISAALLPAFSDLYGRRENARLSRGYESATVLSSVFGVFPCVLAAVLAPAIFQALFPASLHAAAVVFQILMIPAALLAINHAGGAALPAMEGHRFYLMTGCVLAPIALLLNWFLLPRGGATTAAWINVTMQGGAIVASIVYLARRRDLPFPAGRVALIVLAACVAGVVAAVPAYLLSTGRFLTIVAALLGALLSLAVYTLLIVLSGALRSSERQLLHSGWLALQGRLLRRG